MSNIHTFCFLKYSLKDEIHIGPGQYIFWLWNPFPQILKYYRRSEELPTSGFVTIDSNVFLALALAFALPSLNSAMILSVRGYDSAFQLQNQSMNIR